MTRTSPWHSVKQPIHHNNTKCTEGNNIERENRRSGTGGQPLCSYCKRFSQPGHVTAGPAPFRKRVRHAFESIYPDAQVQTYIVHMVRHSLKFLPWKERKEVAAELKDIYRTEILKAAHSTWAIFIPDSAWGVCCKGVQAITKRDR